MLGFINLHSVLNYCQAQLCFLTELEKKKEVALRVEGRTSQLKLCPGPNSVVQGFYTKLNGVVHIH